jgi:hypothetical protein
VNQTSSSVTLIELLLSIVLLSIIILGLSSIDLFSRSHVISSDRRAKISNAASLALEHMGKQIAKAIGNEISGGANSVVDTDAPNKIRGDYALHIYIDANGNGQRDALGTDGWIAYIFTDAHGNPDTRRYQIWYCPNCQNKPCNNCTPNWGDEDNTIARHISALTLSKPVDASNRLNKNYVTIDIQACWDPAQTQYSCGTVNNPSVSIKADIKMPLVSTN